MNDISDAEALTRMMSRAPEYDGIAFGPCREDDCAGFVHGDSVQEER